MGLSELTGLEEVGWLLRDRLRDSLAFLISLPRCKGDILSMFLINISITVITIIVLPEDELPVDEDTDMDLVEDRLALLSLPVR